MGTCINLILVKNVNNIMTNFLDSLKIDTKKLLKVQYTGPYRFIGTTKNCIQINKESK